MSIDEAINILKQYVDYDNPDVPDFYTMEEAIKVIIKALEQEPSYNSIKTELEPCEDAVSRQAVIEILNDAYFLKLDDGAALQESVNQLPPVSPQPKMGRWIFNEIYKHYYCSECKSMGVDYWDYCPNCGAKMQEVEG